MPRPQSSRKSGDRIEPLLRERLNLQPETLAEFCRKHHLKRLWLFGSVLRDDFRPDSDVDVLYEFEDGKTPGLAFFGIANELEELIGRKVDLVSEEYLDPFIKRHPSYHPRLIYGEG